MGSLYFNYFTSTLSGAALDWAVAKAAGVEVRYSSGVVVFDKIVQGELVTEEWRPTYDWRQAGELLTTFNADFERKGSSTWESLTEKDGEFGYGVGSNHRIALCRSIVNLQYGSSVDIPRELV